MSLLRRICVWVTVVATLLAGPAASLAECLRCPPDCPMHAPHAERAPGSSASGGEHDHHGKDAASGGAQDAARRHDDGVGQGADRQAAAHHGAEDCHRAAAPQPQDGPCISGLCGHMDPSIARALPDGVLAGSGMLAAERPGAARLVAPAAGPSLLPIEPPTEPPRSLLA